MAVTIAGVVAACASAPVRFLTLVPPPPDIATGMQPAYSPKISVTVPSQVDQPELVLRQPDGSMALLESERWIAPLGDEIRTALTLLLAPRWPSNAPASLRIAVQVQRFDSVPGRYALIEAAWTVTLDGEPKRSTACRSSIRKSVGAGYPALAAGHRRALEDLAAQMLQAAQALITTTQAPADSIHCSTR
jgi:uncharacterized lipoprotein YmbA